MIEQPILDQDYNQLSLEKKNEYLLKVLHGLLDSAALERDAEAKDCLELFHEYDWEPKEGVNRERFAALLEQGREDNLSLKELDEFLEMVSGSGWQEPHVYFLIRKGAATQTRRPYLQCSNDG